jgi:SP family general alpha glucoside:H+ symporter-like MFS transporter
LRGAWSRRVDADTRLGPWWLVRKGRIDDAKKVLNRISMKGYWEDRNIDAYIEVIKHTDVLERAQAKSGSFWEIWKGTNLRRTEIQMGVWACQVFSGTAMTAYAVEFLEDAGMSTTTAFNFGILINGMNLIGCLIDFVLMTRFGRRTLILCGLNVLALMLVLIGVFGSVTPTHATLQGIGACCAVINLAYHASVGPLTYTVAAEVPASRLRARSVAWGRASYTIMYNATAQLTPRMVSAVDW